MFHFYNNFRRDKIFDIVKFAYLSVAHENLPIFGIAKAKTLAEFVTTESDAARGISRMPLILARLYEEDLKFTDPRKHKLSPNSFQKEQLSEVDLMMQNLASTLDYRNNAKRESIKRVSDHSDATYDDEDFDFDSRLAENERSKSSLLYRRDTMITATFEDFELIKCIGKGTFGKVFLVKCKSDGHLYAMKVIRKDIVIQHDSIDSLEVEKLILLQVNHPFIIGMDYVFQKAYRIYFIMDFI